MKTSHRLWMMFAGVLIATSAARAEHKLMKFTVDGVERQAIVFSPAKQTGNAPLILAFHGHGD